MKKILKYKAIIILLLVFTISFNMISVKQEKEVYAMALVDDVLFWTLGLLVLGTGVVAVSNTQVIDMGSNVFDLLKNDETELERTLKVVDGVYKFVRVTDKLKEIVNQVAENLPSVSSSIITDLPIESNTLITPSFVTGVTFTDTSSGLEIMECYEKDFYRLPFFYEMTVVAKDSTKNANISFISNVKGDYPASISVDTRPMKIKLLAYITKDGYYTVIPYYNCVTYIQSRSIGNVKEPFQFFYQVSNNLIISDMHKIETIPYDQPIIKEGYNPTYTNENLKKDTFIPIPTTVPTDTAISTDMPLDWEKTKEKGLITDIPIDQAREMTGDFTGDVTGEKEGDIVGDITGSLEKGFTLRFPNILDLLKQLLIYLFKPTLALEDIFPFPTDTGLGDLINLYDYSAIWSISPKPIEFKTVINKEGVGNANISRLWNIEFKPFEIPFIANNLNTIRNVFSYSLLLSVIYAIVHHLLPKREMD